MRRIVEKLQTTGRQFHLQSKLLMKGGDLMFEDQPTTDAPADDAAAPADVKPAEEEPKEETPAEETPAE